MPPLLVIGGADAKWFHYFIAQNVYRLTTVRFEAAADVGRLHGVNERVLVNEYARSIGFCCQCLNNPQDLWAGQQHLESVLGGLEWRPVRWPARSCAGSDD